MEAGATWTGTEVSHVAACPEVDPGLCAEQDLPDHLHDLDQSWLRLRAGAGLGLGGGWQLGLELPFDLRGSDITYTTLDGAPYEPPYEDIHHRDETLFGPADGELTLRRYLQRERWVLGGWLGASLPFGRTEEDPFEAGEQGEWHQHTQLGAGLPLALVGASAALEGEWGAMGGLSARVPLAESGKGYRAPLAASARLGPSWSPSRRWLLHANLEGVFESAERWHGEPHGGRQALMAGGLFEWRASPTLNLWAEAAAPLWEHLVVHEHEEDEDGLFHQRPLVGIGLSCSFRELPSRRRAQD